MKIQLLCCWELGTLSLQLGTASEKWQRSLNLGVCSAATPLAIKTNIKRKKMI